MTPSSALGDPLVFLNAKLNDLMFSLYRSRQALTAMQQQAQTDVVMLGQVGEAIAALREQERTLAEIQQRLDSVRGDVEN
jgi:hypothetical protein